MTHQLGSYSPPPSRELYSPPAPYDPLASEKSEGPEPTSEDPSAIDEVHYRKVIYTPPPETRFVAREPAVVTISWPTPKADETRKPESPPRPLIRSLCHSYIFKMSCIGSGIITTMIGYAAITTQVDPYWVGLVVGSAGAAGALGGLIAFYLYDRCDR